MIRGPSQSGRAGLVPNRGRNVWNGLAVVFVSLLLPFLSSCSTLPHLGSTHGKAAAELWIDAVSGDEATDAEVFADLAEAGVIYVGEAHTIQQHHVVQLRLLQEMFMRKVPLVLCLEQLEASDQPAVDRYHRREIDYDALVREIDWAKKWRNYADYRALVEFAHQHQIPIRALNAPPEVIRTVSRGGGIDRLTPAQRAQLPAEIVTEDPAYEQLTNRELAKHMALDPAKLGPVFEAQVSRDETMAANIVIARRVETAPDKPRTAFVVLGAGHMRYGLGTAARVRRREPDIVERLVLISESGDGQLTASEKAATREITISHADLREVGRPPADYIRVLPLANRTLPPGHPPIPQ